MSNSHKVALIIGASGYIGEAVARAFAKSLYLTIGSIRSTSTAAEDLASQGIVPIVGEASDIPQLLQAVQAHADHLDVIVVATEDRSQAHFDATLDLLGNLSRFSQERDVKPLVIYSSGCKDYGPGKLDGEQGLEPDTEASPLNAPPTLASRTQQGLKILTHPKLFDAVAVRPTNVHGYSSSYYGQFIHAANAATQKNARLIFPGDPRTILHSVHVDDCAEAYVALANHPNREQIAGEIFNISAGKRCETPGDLATALQKEMPSQRVIDCVSQPLSRDNVTFAWSQWVDSEKIRKLTGWRDTRPMFAEAIGRYRKEFDDAIQRKDRTALQMLPHFESRMDSLLATTEP